MPARTLRVLVVDDNRDLVETTVSLLRFAGHEATPCYRGDRVMECVRASDPDVIVMDIGLPGQSGWDAAREVRAAIPGRRPLLIGISGQFTRSADRVITEMAGFDYFLAKPADPKVLMTLVEKSTP